jgi:hypothetical protein
MREHVPERGCTEAFFFSFCSSKCVRFQRIMIDGVAPDEKQLSFPDERMMSD